MLKTNFCNKTTSVTKKEDNSKLYDFFYAKEDKVLEYVYIDNFLFYPPGRFREENLNKNYKD